MLEMAGYIFSESVNHDRQTEVVTGTQFPQLFECADSGSNWKAMTATETPFQPDSAIRGIALRKSAKGAPAPTAPHRVL